jgi:hypothetical protein
MSFTKKLHGPVFGFKCAHAFWILKVEFKVDI